MQVGKPIDHLVDGARPGVGVGESLDPVGKVLDQIGAGEVDSAYGEQQDESQAPETDHAVQAPDEALPPDAPWDAQASPPCPDPRPPDDDSREGEGDNQERANAVDLAARRPAKQIVV